MPVDVCKACFDYCPSNFAVVKAATDFAVFKTGFLNLYSPSTGFTVVKTGLLKVQRLAFFNQLQGCQNWFVLPLQAFNKLLGNHKYLAKLLQSFKKLCGSQNDSVESLHPSSTTKCGFSCNHCNNWVRETY